MAEDCEADTRIAASIPGSNVWRTSAAWEVSACATRTSRPRGDIPRLVGRSHLNGGGATSEWLSQPPAVERDQPLPVPLGGRLVVTPALREREAVMDAG